ncbi:hypothetical protein [Actimicrobium antarcticum]|uniref:hypothetical protein n=1 Tax=Actimicrobium antarcticum TaxID=1051899 RepID=UPI0031D15D8D
MSESHTRDPARLAILLMFSCWCTGLAARQRGYRIEHGCRQKASITLSIIPLARWWIAQNITGVLSEDEKEHGTNTLCQTVFQTYV